MNAGRRCCPCSARAGSAEPATGAVFSPYYGDCPFPEGEQPDTVPVPRAEYERMRALCDAAVAWFNFRQNGVTSAKYQQLTEAIRDFEETKGGE